MVYMNAVELNCETLLLYANIAQFTIFYFLRLIIRWFRRSNTCRFARFLGWKKLGWKLLSWGCIDRKTRLGLYVLGFKLYTSISRPQLALQVRRFRQHWWHRQVFFTIRLYWLTYGFRIMIGCLLLDSEPTISVMVWCLWFLLLHFFIISGRIHQSILWPSCYIYRRILSGREGDEKSVSKETILVPEIPDRCQRCSREEWGENDS